MGKTSWARKLLLISGSTLAYLSLVLSALAVAFMMWTYNDCMTAGRHGPGVCAGAFFLTWIICPFMFVGLLIGGVLILALEKSGRRDRGLIFSTLSLLPASILALTVGSFLPLLPVLMFLSLD